jgi:PKD repeat protein
VRPALASGAQPAAAAATGPQPDTPAYLQQAYDLSYLSQTGGAGDTVAVVDAYNDPSAETDLKTYRSHYGLPACTTANGCFHKVGQNGGSTFPVPDATWEQEIALDLDAVSAICPQCHILLVEANSNSLSDLQAAMNTAANATPTPSQISASWWGVSSTVPPGFPTLSGIATVAATGDGGYAGPGEDSYPAAIPGVTAAGGTSLGPAAAPSARGFGEAAWSWNGVDGGGSGCDLNFSRPSYQPAAGCAGRAYADLSADADPNTGLAVYNQGNWSLIGGTSLSAPMIAAYYAITGVASATPGWAYGDSGTLNDILSGSSGNCASSIAYICNAGTGYDGPTGVGSISGSVVVGAPGIGGPPLVTNTGANTYVAGVSPHGATITGGIYRNGLDTKWWIQYGTTTAYGQQTPVTDIGAGSAAVTVTGNPSRLSAGTLYHYRLVAQNSLGTAFGSDDTFTTQPAPAGGPTASFDVTPGTPSPAVAATFDASSSTAGTVGSISDYSWTFGDGTSTQDAGASATTSHTFASRGTYTVTLTITSSGQTDTSTQTVTVDDPPNVSFTPSPSAVPAGTTIAFNAGASTAGSGGSITDYSWNFGDGTPTQDTGSAPTTSHAFTARGVYTVTLTITDDLGTTTSTTQQVTVDRPIAAFTTSQTGTAPDASVSFDASSTTDPESSITDYSWDFGDGTSVDAGPADTVSHTFTAAGTYTATLTVTDQLGFGDTTSGQVLVPEPVQSTGSPPPVTPPVSEPVPTPPASPPATGSQPPSSLVVKLTGAGRQRLAAAKAHGLRLGLAVNQPVAASFQITIPLAETQQGGHLTHGAKRNPTATVVLLRARRTLAAGGSAVVLKLSRGAVGRLARTGRLVLTVRVTLTTAAGKKLTRTAKITLTR